MVEIHLKKKKKSLGTHAKELLFLQFSASSQPCTEQGPQWGKGRKTEQVKKTNSRIFKDCAKAFQRKCLKFKKLFYFIKKLNCLSTDKPSRHIRTWGFMAYNTSSLCLVVDII